MQAAPAIQAAGQGSPPRAAAIHAAAPRIAKTTLRAEIAFGVTPAAANFPASARAQAVERVFRGRREGSSTPGKMPGLPALRKAMNRGQLAEIRISG